MPPKGIKKNYQYLSKGFLRRPPLHVHSYAALCSSHVALLALGFLLCKKRSRERIQRKRRSLVAGAFAGGFLTNKVWSAHHRVVESRAYSSSSCWMAGESPGFAHHVVPHFVFGFPTWQEESRARNNRGRGRVERTRRTNGGITESVRIRGGLRRIQSSG